MMYYVVVGVRVIRRKPRMDNIRESKASRVAAWYRAGESSTVTLARLAGVDPRYARKIKQRERERQYGRHTDSQLRELIKSLMSIHEVHGRQIAEMRKSMDAIQRDVAELRQRIEGVRQRRRDGTADRTALEETSRRR